MLEAASNAQSPAHAEYDALYSKGGFGYDDAVDSWRAWLKRHYVDEFGLTAGTRLLDVGCGDGFWSMLFAEHDIVVSGCDRSPVGIEVAQARLPEATFVVADINEQLPFPPSSFDVGFMRGLSTLGAQTIDVPVVATQITNVAKVLRPGGMLLLSQYVVLGVEQKDESWSNHRLSEIIAALETLATPSKITYVPNYLQLSFKIDSE
jgi:ubiquinone/menaquinone biosynthesis C-methylase UbiE